MGESRQLILADARATESLGATLAAILAERRVHRCLILLQGELGAGKTTLVRGFLQRLGHAGPVPSPTYTLVEPYELSGIQIYHLDLYRIGGSEELEYLGWRDLEEGVVLVEWPERAADLGERADLSVRLEHHDQRRSANLSASSSLGLELLAALGKEFPT